MKIGWIGLGNIGGVMAANLIKEGYHLIVHDLEYKAAEKLIAAGAEWADTPQALAAEADTIITSLPGPPQVRSVMESKQGVFSGIRAGATWIDMSTTDAEEVERLGIIAAEKDVSVLEAPLTGGVTLARAGGITMLVGGEKDVFESQLPMLKKIGGTVLLLSLIHI